MTTSAKTLTFPNRLHRDQQRLLLRPLTTPDDLHRWVRLFCNLNVPRMAACPGHSAPFDYLVRAYFEPASDQVVHAPRGGGKTRLAAVATLLDVLHKPGISVRILGGSLEQSLRLWEHLVPDLSRAARSLLERRIGAARRITLTNGSSCAVLTQSQRAVRGLRVQKLRCDEVELFKPDVWEAAQLVTRSKRSAPISQVGRESDVVGRDPRHSTTTDPRPTTHALGEVHGAIDALSTLHAPFGLMQQVIDNAERTGTPIVRWCVLDVLERCPPERECAGCPLWDECGGLAKRRCDGFITIDDAIRLKRRVSLQTWKSEMLCQRPSTRNAVYASFDPDVHVVPTIGTGHPDASTISLAIDFGYTGAFACLWVRTEGAITYVVDEYVQSERTLAEHIAHIERRPWPRAAFIACDPAGNGRNDQTGLSNVQQLKRAGFTVRFRASHITDGVELVRAALRPAIGEPTLYIHPRCVKLIRSIQAYRYATLAGSRSELPLKDGDHDHAVDALRYHFINARRQPLADRSY